MAEITAYPLCWPTGWKRTTSRKRATFHRIGYEKSGDFSFKRRKELSVAEATKRLLASLRLMGVPDYNCIISTNVRLRRDGLPYSNDREPVDPGVAVYWVKQGKRQSMAIDLYDRVADNIAAVALTLDYMRGIERHGGAEILERAFLGFQSLPPPMAGARPWQDVFDVGSNASLAEVESKYSALAKIYHPDRGGDHERMAEINEAMRQAREHFKVFQ